MSCLGRVGANELPREYVRDRLNCFCYRSLDSLTSKEPSICSRAGENVRPSPALNFSSPPPSHRRGSCFGSAARRRSPAAARLLRSPFAATLSSPVMIRLCVRRAPFIVAARRAARLCRYVVVARSVACVCVCAVRRFVAATRYVVRLCRYALTPLSPCVHVPYVVTSPPLVVPPVCVHVCACAPHALRSRLNAFRLEASPSPCGPWVTVRLVRPLVRTVRRVRP